MKRDATTDTPEIVRFAAPSGWTSEDEPEANVFVAPGGTIRLRLIAEWRPVDEPAVSLRETALLYLRPSDSRVGDRVLEDFADDGLIATATLRVGEADAAAVHYLWFVGWAEDAAVNAAMFALAVPATEDGRPETAATVNQADRAIRAIRKI